MITQRDLADAVRRRAPGAWSVVERVQDLAVAAETPARLRREHRRRLTLIVHHDLPRGRGSARIDVDPTTIDSASDLVDQAISLAITTAGPAWISAPPAAPAKVNLVDPELVERELGAVAAGTLARLRRPDRTTVIAATAVLRETVTVLAGSGFHTSWLATTLHGDALVAAGDHSFAVARRARRIADFDLDAALADAAADLSLLADAAPPTPGPCALWLGPDALLPARGRVRLTTDAADPLAAGSNTDPAGELAADLAPGHIPGAASLLDHAPLPHGLWTLFAYHADAVVERQGLTRVRLRAELAPGASQLPEPLAILSHGALDFAMLSAPVTDEAVAVRSFPIVERGVAVGLGLSSREAALRRTDPNGGVRNLAISGGSWSPAPSPSTRTIELRRLRALSIDPYTGDAVLDIALALDHRPNRPNPTPFTGGTLRLDLVTTLARARRSANLLRRGAYHGPASIFIDDAELIA